MTISLQHCKKGEEKENLKLLLNKINFKPKINSTVLIKPNLCAIKPKDESEITNPKLIEALIDYLRIYGCKILIAETNNLGPRDKKYTFNNIINNSGYKYLNNLKGVNFIDLEKGQIIKKKVIDKILKVPKIIYEVDYYINFAKLKTHFISEVSLCLKNQMGIVPESERMRYHRENLNMNIAYLSTILKPDLCLIDGIIGMEGKGPHWGKKKRCNLLIAGTNNVEIDSFAVALINQNPDKVKHLKLSKDLSSGKYYSKKYVDLINKYKIDFEPASEVTFQYGNFYIYLDKGKPCNCCGRTVEYLLKKSYKNPIVFMKVLYYYLFKKTTIIIGKVNDKKFNISDKNLKKVYCIGKCTKNLAQKHKFNNLDKCPPSLEEAMDFFKNN
jgi:uncharacterized protein (DUF362 family)